MGRKSSQRSRFGWPRHDFVTTGVGLAWLGWTGVGLARRAAGSERSVMPQRPARTAEIEAELVAKGLKSRIHRRAARNHPLSQKQEAANTVRSRVRARVEHVFGHQENSMGRKIVRTIGMARARFKIGMMNLGYNMRRLVQLERVAAAPA